MKKRIGLLLLSVVLSICMSVPLIADIRVIDDDSIEGRINKVLSQEAWKELDSVELENFLCDIIFLEEEVSNLSEEEKKGFDTVINQSGCDQAGFMPTYIPDKNRLTKTRSQNPYGSCWAHSACAVAEMDAISDGANRNDLDESELHIVNYAYTKRGIKYKGIAGDGTAKKTFKINAININENTGIVAKIVPDSIKIATEGKYKDKYTASVSVTFNGKPLIEGKDYTLSFKNNEKLEGSEKVPEVIIKGMGNYKKSISILFTVK